MKEKQLLDYNIDEIIDALVLIKSSNNRIAKNGKPFIDLVLSDLSGEIGAKVWGASKEDIENFTSGKVVKIKGKRESYLGKPQIRIDRIRVAKHSENNNPKNFVPQAILSKDEMEELINQSIFEITNPVWNRIVRYLIKQYGNAFFDYPAAKMNHHAYQGGLAFHTISILNLAHSVVKQYEDINASLLYSGAILHDLGKTLELSGALSTQYTVEGNLLGHISIMDGEIVKAAQTLGFDENSEDIYVLRHMILSHHGKREYGSPVTPKVLEAQILHDLDNLDASIVMMKGALNHTEPGEYSDKIYGMNGTRFYKPTDKRNDTSSLSTKK